MRPPKRTETGQQDLLRSRLDQAIFGALDAEERSQLRRTLAKLDRVADALEAQGGLDDRARPAKAAPKA